MMNQYLNKYSMHTKDIFEQTMLSCGYVIDKIIVFNPITFINVRRNEVKEKIKLQSVQKSMKNGTGDATIYTKDMINQRGSI